jgi:hypothetical protein
MDLGLLHYDIFNSIGYKPLQIMAVFFDPEVERTGDYVFGAIVLYYVVCVFICNNFLLDVVSHKLLVDLRIVTRVWCSAFTVFEIEIWML